MIELRTKTRNMLQEISQEMVTKVEETIKTFCEKKEAEAYAIILKMRVQPEEALKDLGLEEIPVEHVQKLRGDMSANYKAVHPNCWLKTADKYPAELSKALQGDVTLLQLIEERCKEVAYLCDDDVNRIIYLTSQEDEKYRFGGLRAMHFKVPEATILKDYANQICEYFKTFVPKKETVGIEIPKDFVPALEPVKAPVQTTTTVKKEPATPAKTESDEKKEVKLLTYEDILSNKMIIMSYIYAYQGLEKAGIDAKQVMEKADKIMALINAAADF